MTTTEVQHKPLRVYNSATRSKETFEPLSPDCVKMYVCGPTVYNLVHIGNARPVVVFDTLFRVLQSIYPKVIYARNITDIDDKIIKAAAEQNIEIGELTSRYAKAYSEDMSYLNTLEPSITPYATEHLPEMIAMVQKLVDQGHAYESEGHVLFDVTSMESYGTLSNRSLDDMLDGARVEVAGYKRYAGDFVLWKPSNDSDPGWDSPWGRGRPGWHLECSAMIEKHLGDTIDIHGGGRDLIFPHHENERAQSECAHGGTHYVKYWMHNGYLNIGGEKMSKSLGNFRTVRELLESYDGEVIRLALLSAQYRSELDFSPELLDQAKTSLDTLYGALKAANAASDNSVAAEQTGLQNNVAYQALLDDLNTPLAISELHRLSKEINKNISADESGEILQQLKAQLQSVATLMGLLQHDPEAWFKGGNNDDGAEIDALIAERQQAKVDKNWARADEIRKSLKEQGVELLDSKEGTSWRRI